MVHNVDYIDRIVEEYTDMLLRIARHYTNNNDDAFDVVQNVFIKLVHHNNKDNKFKSKEHEKAWLIRVVINQSKDYLKSAWHKNTTHLEDNIITTNNTDFVLLNAVSNLPNNYKNVIYLYYYENYSTDEIAKILKVNKNTIMSWLHRARKQLKIILEEEKNYE